MVLLIFRNYELFVQEEFRDLICNFTAHLEQFIFPFESDSVISS